MQDPRPETPRESAQRRLQSVKTGVVVASVASLVGFVGVAATHGDGGSATASSTPPAAASNTATPSDDYYYSGGDRYQLPQGTYGQPPQWSGDPSSGSSSDSTNSNPSQSGGVFGDGGGAQAPVGSSGAS